MAVAARHARPRIDVASATFTLSRVETKERTCTGRDRDLLSGQLRIRVRSLVNQSNGLGTVSGKAELKGADKTKAMHTGSP